MNAGLISHHLKTNQAFNNDNHCYGIEYRYSTTQGISAGRFYNSVRKDTQYVVWSWQPVQFGVLHLGIMMGGIDGYPNMNNGGWFLAALPVATIEYQRFGVNFTVIPTIQDRIYGVASIQLKIKLY